MIDMKGWCKSVDPKAASIIVILSCMVVVFLIAMAVIGGWHGFTFGVIGIILCAGAVGALLYLGDAVEQAVKRCQDETEEG